MKFSIKILFFFIVITPFVNGCKNKQPEQKAASPFDNNTARYSLFDNATDSSQAFAVSANIHVVLDSLSSLKMMDSLVNGKRLLLLDGIAHFTIDHSEHPIVIYTGMMKLTTQQVDFEINAYNESPGQSLKVFGGKLIATKSYKSDFPNTDTLTKGGMILINRDIDLMEKETFDTTQTLVID